MNPLYQQAINGTLASPADAGTFTASVSNGLCVPLSLFWIGTNGRQYPISNGSTDVIAPGAYFTLNFTEGYYVLKVAATGAFAAVIYISSDSSPNAEDDWVITPDLLSLPNDIGAFATPNSTIAVPPDSARVLVACGTLPNGGAITRDQYWKRLGDSYVVAAGTERTVSTTVTSGTQTTTSEQTTLSTSLGFSGAVTWGVISTSISANLSYESTSFQQVAVAQQVTQYESMVLKNTGTTDQMFLRWQLTDVITLFDGNNQPTASLSSGEAPIFVDGPYDPKDLPAPPSLDTTLYAMPQSLWNRVRKPPATAPA